MADQEGVQLSMDDAIKQSMNAEAPAQQTVKEETAAIEPIAPTLPVGEIPAEPIVEATATAAEPAFNELELVKKIFGDDIDIETIKAKLNAPAPEPLRQEPTFENENSKKIYEALLSGKENEVAEYLSKKQFVSSLKEKSPEEIVKAGWKTEYGLTDKEADRKFNKDFQVDELLEDEDKEIEKKFVAKKIENEAEKYKSFFSQYEQEIKLPSIETPAPAGAAPQVDYTSEAARNAISFSEKLNSKPVDISNIDFEFADNSLKLKGQVNIPTEEVAKIKTQLNGHEDKFIENRWFKNGEFNADLFARDIYLLTNPNAVVNAGVSQTVHQARIEWLKENRNHKQPGAVITGDFAPSEDEQKREWYRKYMM